ncbi:MAG: oxygen-dependent coproporphyrinogen oxidase [Flavobacteriales bacterium]|nr:oxygen-dependent coproporphyrinogen oxidase [Flavobacteriales bacterium]
MQFREKVQRQFKLLQDEICAGLEKLDGVAQFQEDLWTRSDGNHEDGGGGRTRILENGNLIEKGGVNFSAVHGELPEAVFKTLGVSSAAFFACGVSIVLHPHNPHVPIIHMNVRYFELEDGTYWFGGGIDLTPHFIVPEKAKDFHTKLKNTCDQFNPDFYSEFKVWADNYFFNEHRNETRGVGGIFYDKLTEEKTGLTKDELLDYSIKLGQTFVPAYAAQDSGRDQSFSDAERQWQLLRRGRYVEFNLVYDRGTKFGLQTSGRIESILMSLPKDASWLYNYQPSSDAERFTLANLNKGIDWLASI